MKGVVYGILTEDGYDIVYCNQTEIEDTIVSKEF